MSRTLTTQERPVSRMKPVPMTIESAIDSANSEVEALAEEMTSWADNIEEKFSNTAKYETVRQTADTLSGVNAPDAALAGQHDLVTNVDVTGYALPKRPSRRDRRDYAAALYATAAEALRTLIDDVNSRADAAEIRSEKPEETHEVPEGHENDDAEELRSLVSDLETLADDCESAQSEIEECEFPGMFG